jgi:hypothetical protein
VCVCVCVSSLCLCVVGIDSSKFKRATPQDTAQRVSKDPAMNDSNNVSAFKEFKWYNTHNIPIEIQCGVCRLELPIDLSINSDDPSSCVFAGGDVFLTAHIICNQVPLHECPMYTHFAVPDGHRNALVWDCVLSFPVKLRDLSLNAVLAITAWTSTGRVIGGTTMRFFDNNGSLKRGKQKLIFFFGRQADTNVIADKNETPGELYDLYAAHDYGFMMEKHLEAYRASISEYDAQLRMGKSEFAGKVDWLDRLTLTRIQSTLEEANSRFGQLQSQYTVDYGSTFVPSKDASTFDIQVGRDRSTTGNINLGSSANNGAGTVYSLPPEEWEEGMSRSTVNKKLPNTPVKYKLIISIINGKTKWTRNASDGEIKVRLSMFQLMRYLEVVVDKIQSKHHKIRKVVVRNGVPYNLLSTFEAILFDISDNIIFEI